MNDHDASERLARLSSHPIRSRPDDMEVLANLVRELAVYEKLEEHAQATPDDFRRHLFGPRPAAEAALAEVAGEPVGFALWFTTFSTFRGQPGIYLEDLFVRPEFRGRGIGKALLAGLARLAVERGCGKDGVVRAELERAGDRLLPRPGRRPMDEWTVYRIDDEPLRRLAAIGREPRR